MSETYGEVIEVDDCNPSSSLDQNPSRPVACLTNREEMKKLEKEEDCFILEFDPSEELDLSKLTYSNDNNCDINNGEADELRILSEKLQVACRDYPHPRHICANFPFDQTPHETHCQQCFCYACDKAAPCAVWWGADGHCHASDNEHWRLAKKKIRSVN